VVKRQVRGKQLDGSRFAYSPQLSTAANHTLALQQYAHAHPRLLGKRFAAVQYSPTITIFVELIEAATVEVAAANT
jgi:hypothetical protein